MDLNPDLLDDVQEWEPKNPEEWERYDPIGPRADWPRLNTNIERSAYSSTALFAGWRRLPAILRAQVWREREIASYLFRNSGSWAERLPILEAVGVTKRSYAQSSNFFPFFPDWDHPLFYEYWRSIRHGDVRRAQRINEEIRREFGFSIVNGMILTGTLFISRALPIVGDLLDYLRIRPLQDIGSRISNLTRYGLSPTVPINIEYSDDFMLLSSVNLPQPIQGGLLIRGEHPSGFRKPGTIATIAHDWNNNCVLVGAQHVLGDVGNNVILNGQCIGEVIDSDAALDAAIARVFDPIKWDKTIKGLTISPSAPVFVTTGLSVQFEGGVSGSQYGTVDVVNRVAPGQYRVGSSPSFTVLADGKPGDSGSLIITGHGNQTNLPQAFINQNPQLASLYSNAMLGMLLAGPGPGYPKQEPAKIIARPILEIGARFNLNW